MNILVITSEPFPAGGAATNRMLSYLARIVSQGFSIDLISFSNSSGIAEGGWVQSNSYVGIRYACIRAISGDKVLKRIIRFVSYSLLILHLIINPRRRTPDIVLSVSNDSLLHLVGYVVAKVNKAKYILEKSEYPFSLMKASSPFQKKLALLKIQMFYKLFDGMLVMTQNLIGFLSGVCKKNVMFHHMPMTVDFSRFPRIESLKENWITYIGSFGPGKDGVHDLVEAFKIVNAIHPDWSLVLIGAASLKEAFILEKLIEDYGIKDKVIFTGKINYDRVPSYLLKSKILVLSRPSSLQAHYGFPSKLGEYLATGNPVVVTDVGEIKLYLQDGISAMIAKAGNISEFAEKINYLIENHDMAERIGAQGKKVAIENFDADKNTASFSKYLQDLVNNK